MASISSAVGGLISGSGGAVSDGVPSRRTAARIFRALPFTGTSRSIFGSCQRSHALSRPSSPSILSDLPLLITSTSVRGARRLARSPGSNHFLAALAAQYQFARFGHAPRDRQDFLLRRFHFADFHRALGLQIVTQQFTRTLGHVLEYFFPHQIVGALEIGRAHV